MPDWSSWEFWAKAWELAWELLTSQELRTFVLTIAAIIGLPLLYIRTRAADSTAHAALEQAKAALKQSETAAERHKQQTAADLERRITESFARAIEQLGDDKLEVRLGGIYTLERIARESKHDYWPIMETLTAFVRKRAPWPPKSSRADEIRPETDIQAVLTVLGRRDEKMRQRDRGRLDLSETDLRGADLTVAHLKGANLMDAHLEDATLMGARLEDATLVGAHLEDATLVGAHLKGAWLEEVHLTGADLDFADLRAAKNLTQEQVNAANGDARTQLPGGLTRPAHWSAPAVKPPPATQE